MSTEIEHLVGPEQIRMVLAIAEARSFSGAAGALGVSQPSISQQVKRLEARAGRNLFRRVRTGIELTSDGEALVIYARAMVALSDDLRRHFRDNASTVKLQIGMAEDFCRTALPTVLWLFMREHPNVEMRIVCGTIDYLMAAVEARTVDFAVMRRHPGVLGLPTLWSDTLVWVGRPDLPQPIPDPVPLVLPVHPSPLRAMLLEALQANGRTWRIPFEGQTLTSMEAALQAGLGVSAPPRSMPLRGTVVLDLRHGLPDLPDVEFVMVEPNRPVSTAVSAFCEVLRQAARLSFDMPAPLGL